MNTATLPQNEIIPIKNISNLVVGRQWQAGVTLSHMIKAIGFKPNHGTSGDGKAQNQFYFLYNGNVMAAWMYRASHNFSLFGDRTAWQEILGEGVVIHA